MCFFSLSIFNENIYTFLTRSYTQKIIKIKLIHEPKKAYVLLDDE